MPKKNSAFKRAFRVMAAMCVAAGFLTPGARAQSAGQIIGQVTGGDISIVGTPQAAPGGNPQTMAFAAGNTIVVHSGQARVEFTGGGELDVCGPAKFTVLASDDAIMIALSFGRVHAKFDSSRPISLYTPLITATLLAVANHPRDVTFGVTPATGAMCALAAHGALQVQQQLSGESLIVPQPSEILLSGMPLGATPATPGSCQCDFQESTAKMESSTPVVAMNTIPMEAGPISGAKPSAESHPGASVTTTDEPTAAAKTATPPAIPSNSASSQPPVPAPKPLPPATQPIIKIEPPPIAFSAKPIAAPEETISVATLILAKDSSVEPAWIFHGRVAAPQRAAHSVKSAREPDSSPQIASGRALQSAPKPAKRGFWGKLRDFLVGKPKSAPCPDADCS
jgi:hypothetical protein